MKSVSVSNFIVALLTWYMPLVMRQLSTEEAFLRRQDCYFSQLTCRLLGLFKHEALISHYYKRKTCVNNKELIFWSKEKIHPFSLQVPHMPTIHVRRYKVLQENNQEMFLFDIHQHIYANGLICKNRMHSNLLNVFFRHTKRQECNTFWGI